MTALEIYRAQYEQEKDWYHKSGDSKHVWAARRIFDLTTYDSGLDELFINDILEVCKVILEKKNYEYIKDEKNYIKYALVCQLLDKFNWIEWGSSIRGAWFEVDSRYDFKSKSTLSNSRDILDELEWWDDKHHVIEKVPFTVDNLEALIEFMEEPCESIDEGEEE